MDKELLKGCRSASDLVNKLLEHHGYAEGPHQLGLIQLAAQLAREKYGVYTNLALCEALIEELFPEARRLFVKPEADSADRKVLLEWAAEVALIEYMQSKSQEKLPVSTAATLMNSKYGTPKRMNSKYSENVKNPAVRELADQLLRLMEERGVDLEILINSYMKRKTQS